MRHRQIEAFRAVMLTGTITEAGRMLRISQPSVSRLIADLERSLSFALFERRQGRISPTPEAVRLFEEVERSFAGLDKLRQFAREIRDLNEAHLTVAAMPALCLDLLPEAVARFLELHPEAHVALHARSSHQIVDWVMGQRCELALAAPPFDVRGVAGEMLVSTPCVCVLPAGHALADRDRIDAADLHGETVILLTDSMLRHRLDHLFAAEGVRPASRVETPLSIVACRLAELGTGIAMVEPFTAKYCLGRNIVVRPFRPAVPFVFGILSPEGRPYSMPAKRLLEVLRLLLESYELPGSAEITVSPFRPVP